MVFVLAHFLNTKPVPTFAENGTEKVMNISRPHNQKPNVNHTTGLAMAAGGATLFSIKGIVMKLAFERGGSVEQMMSLRLGLSIPIFIVIAVWAARKHTIQPSIKDMVICAGLGVLSYYLCTWLDFTGLQYISAQLERLILFLYPTIVAILALIFLGDRFGWRHGAALLLSYVGVAILALREYEGLGTNALLGAGLVFLCSVLFAIYAVASKPMIGRVGVPIFTALAMGGAGVAIIIHYGILVGIGAQTPVWTLEIWGLGAFLAIFCTVIAALMMNEGVSRIGPGLASATGGVGPAVTAIFAVLILDEPFGWQHAVALCLTVGGVLLLVQIRRTKAATL